MGLIDADAKLSGSGQGLNPVRAEGPANGAVHASEDQIENSNTPSEVQLQADSVTRRFGAFSALDQISIDIRSGEFLTLLGPSGSGKSTFLNILAGFDFPTSGRLIQGGRDVTLVPAEKRNFGMVFQGYALFPHLTVLQNVAFPLRVRKLPKDDQRRKALDVLDRVGLAAHADKLPRQLSGGQQQRVALARALVFSPDMLLLDEPLSALDKNLREQLQFELKRIHNEFGTTFVFVTHDQAEALALSSRIAIFNHGKLLQLGPPADVYSRPRTQFVAEFLGRINLFPLSGMVANDGMVTGRFGDRVIKARGDAGGAQVVGVRPEHMSLTRTPTKGVNAVEAVIEGKAYQGGTTQFSLRPASGGSSNAYCIDVPTARLVADPFEPGQTCWLNWEIEHGLVLGEEA